MLRGRVSNQRHEFVGWSAHMYETVLQYQDVSERVCVREDVCVCVCVCVSHLRLQSLRYFDREVEACGCVCVRRRCEVWEWEGRGGWREGGKGLVQGGSRGSGQALN